MDKEIVDYPIAAAADTKTEAPNDEITIGPIPQEYVQQVQQQQSYAPGEPEQRLPDEQEQQQQERQEHLPLDDEQQRQAAAAAVAALGHFQHHSQLVNLSQHHQQQQPNQALMSQFMHHPQSAAYYEAHQAQWNQQVQQYTQWQHYQQQWHYQQQCQWQHYHWQQWQRQYMGHGRGHRRDQRRRKERALCPELHPKFEPNYKTPRKTTKKRNSPLLAEERVPEEDAGDHAIGGGDEKDEDGPTIGMKQKCIQHAIASSHHVDTASHKSSSSQNLAILAAVAVADLEKERELNVDEHEKAIKKVAAGNLVVKLKTFKMALLRHTFLISQTQKLRRYASFVFITN